jgi:hypothetical protein
LCKATYFQKFLTGQEDSLLLEDPTGKLDDVIHFLYEKLEFKPDAVNSAEIDQFLLAAEFYGLPELEDFIFEKLTEISQDYEGVILKCINRSEIFRVGSVKFLSKNFEKILPLFQKGLSIQLVNPELLNLIISSPHLSISSESILGNALLQYLQHNQKELDPKSIHLLLSQIHYHSLPVILLLQYSLYLPHLPSDFQSIILHKLYQLEMILPPASLTSSLTPTLSQKRKYLESFKPLTFTIYHALNTYLSVNTTDGDNRAIISKTTGEWWQNVVSEQKLEGRQKIFYKLNSTGGKYVGIGIGSKDYESIESFLGQRTDGWCLCTSAGYNWDGHIFNGITTAVGIPYAPPELLGPGATVELDIDMNEGTAHWVIGNRVLPIAWNNIKGDVYVIVSMFMPGSCVTVWRE